MKIFLLLTFLFLSFQEPQSVLKYGEYRMKDRKESQGLLIKSDSTYSFNKGGYSYSWGTWTVVDEKLILNSRMLTKADSLSLALSSSSFIRFENKIFTIKRGRLIDNEGCRFTYKSK